MQKDTIGSCEYEIWDKKKKIMRQCGKDCIREEKLHIPDFIPQEKIGNNFREIYLCEEHREFVIDSLRSEYYVAHKKAINDRKQKELFKK